MVNYQNGKIYKIVSNTDSDKCYVGSTTKQYLSQRWMQHKANYKHDKDGKYHKITSFDLFDEFGIENCVIVLLESFPCNSKDHLHSREKFYIESSDCVNKTIPGRPFKEYYQKYYEENKILVIEKQKEYQNKNKEIILEKQKEYYKENKETVLEKHKEHYENNKSLINEKRKEKIICECGSFCRKSDRTKHFKTAKHQTYLLKN